MIAEKKRKALDLLREQCKELGIKDEVFSNKRYEGITLLNVVFERSFISRFGPPDWHVFFAIFTSNPRGCLIIIDGSPPIGTDIEYPEDATLWSIIEDKPPHIVELVEEARRVCPDAALVIILSECQLV